MRKKIVFGLTILLIFLGVAFFMVSGRLPAARFLPQFAALVCFGAALVTVLFWPWQKPLLSKISRILKMLTLVAVVLVLISFIIVQSLIWHTAAQARQNEPDAQIIIVLGAGLINERPSLPLSLRLQSALAYLQANPASVAVLSGGQDERNSISEAMAMQRWLVNYGIEVERLFLEEHSTSTAENFAFSMYHLNQLGAEQIVVVTNEFHLHRSAHLARHYGLEPQLLGSSLEPLGNALPHGELVALNSYIREYFAVLRDLIRIYIMPSSLPVAL